MYFFFRFSITKFSFVMVMLTNVCGVGQYKIEIDHASLTNNSECAKSTVNPNCLVCFIYLE